MHTIAKSLEKVTVDLLVVAASTENQTLSVIRGDIIRERYLPIFINVWRGVPRTQYMAILGCYPSTQCQS